MKWSLLVGKVWGTEIRLHASLLFLIPYGLIVFKPQDLPSALRVLLLIAAIFACVGLHEIGHTAAARVFGIQVNSIVLWPLGGFANLSRRPEKALPDLVISAAGPCMNFLIFAGLAILTLLEQFLERWMYLPGLAHFLWRLDIFPFLVSLTIANLSLAVFNLVPVYPLDGGQIARGLLKLAFGEKNADRVMLIISLPLALAITIAGFVMRDVIVILTGLILLLAGATLSLRLFNWLTMGGLYFIDRAGYYLKRSDFDQAVREYTRAIERNPNRAGLYISRAVAYMNLMNLGAVRMDNERALKLDPNNHIAWAMRGEMLMLDKNYAAALAAYNRAIALHPNWSIGYIDRGGLYQEQGDYRRAVEDLDKAVAFGHGTPAAYILRSILRYQMGDKEGSHADTDQALHFAPHWMLVFPDIFLLNLRGQLDWALDYYWRAIERMPKAYQVYQGRADACRENNRASWAIADYDRAIQLAPKQAEPYLGRGKAYQMIQQADQAARDFREAARLAKKSHIRRQAETLLKGLNQNELKPVPVSLSTAVPGAAAGQSEPVAPSAETAGTTPSSD